MSSNVHSEFADALDERRIRDLLAIASARGDLFGLLGEVKGRNGVLAHGFLILLVELRVLVLNNLAHAELGQLLRHELGVEKPALDRGLVLDEGGDDLVKVLLADTLRFAAPTPVIARTRLRSSVPPSRSSTTVDSETDGRSVSAYQGWPR
jgi:hypothetical protein